MKNFIIPLFFLCLLCCNTNKSYYGKYQMTMKGKMPKDFKPKTIEITKERVYIIGADNSINSYTYIVDNKFIHLKSADEKIGKNGILEIKDNNTIIERITFEPLYEGAKVIVEGFTLVSEFRRM